ncbi:hypothetical protein [Nonomuraea sp. NPDC003201]
MAKSAGAHAHLADFGRLAGELLERCPRIDVLANNAGALFSSRALTPDRRERTFQINHLAPFLLSAPGNPPGAPRARPFSPRG